LEVKDLDPVNGNIAAPRYLQPSPSSILEFFNWPHPFVHIVNTRFQQEQANLTALGRARLVLFETFCLKSILGQTVLQQHNATLSTPPFLWIIKVDPQLTQDLLQDLISLVENYPFVYVVASNTNFGVGQRVGGWRGGQAGKDVLTSKVYTGNRSFLRQAHLARASRAVLETRIDADDGLHLNYLETLQAEASKRLLWQSNNQTSSPQRQRWMYWCALNHADWSPTPPELAGNDSPNRYQPFGLFIPKRSAHVCITAGITLGVSIGVKEDQIPHYMHHQLVQKVRDQTNNEVDCGGEKENSKCLKLMKDPFPGAIRSRTPTSAGMRGVLSDEGALEQKMGDNLSVLNKNATVLSILLLWKFNCDLEEVVEANRYLQNHLVDITADNLRGQCTRGHSCKLSTKEVLRNLLDTHSSNSSQGKKFLNN